MQMLSADDALDARIAPRQGNTTQEAKRMSILCRLGVHWWERCPDPTAWQCVRCWKIIGRW